MAQICKQNKKIFNYRVSRARWLIENAFGILASKFRIFQKPIPSNDETNDKIIRTSCALPIGYVSQIPAITFQRGCVDEEDRLDYIFII